MSKDRDLVNLSEDHELNHHLRKAGKRQTQENRDELVNVAHEVKRQLGKTRLRHEELEAGIEKNKRLFK